MGLYPQPNNWSCGPFALKHALVVLGKLVPEQRLAKLAGTHWWSGTDDVDLALAARENNCRLSLVRKRSAEPARKALSALLGQRIPVLLCVDDWEHWIAVVKRDRVGFVILDSNLPTVLEVLSWAQLRKRWQYLDVDYDEEEPPELFDMYPVEPQFRVTIKADFSAARVRHLRRSENRSLARYWDVLLDDLLAICRPPSSRLVEPLSMAELLRRNQETILARVSYWHGDVERSALARLLASFRFVAETYGLVIPAASARRAVIDLAVLTTMWAVASRGVGDMYGTDSH